MKINTLATAVACMVVGTSLSAREDHLWNLAVDQGPTLCSFSDNVPVQLILDPLTNNFELGSEGSLKIQAQGISKITYTTDNQIRNLDGSIFAEGRNFNLEGTTLEGPDGTAESEKVNCSPTGCSGMDFTLPEGEVLADYLLTVVGTVAPPADYVATSGDEFFLTYRAQCLEN
ncbi:hypothetical protein [uncultured Ruegeria sp.]|uniref:hypothetical protein n=1 Tax=uncultured Ruegeria sp. TaxID=259304 RepID=UPI002601DCA2|nr:hypothetical protein [uncultured Ruegeria sp.]